MFLAYPEQEMTSSRKDICVAPEAVLKLVVKMKPYLPK